MNIYTDTCGPILSYACVGFVLFITFNHTRLYYTIMLNVLVSWSKFPKAAVRFKSSSPGIYMYSNAKYVAT